MPCGVWFCPMVLEPVEPYFTRFLRVLSFCLVVSKIVIFKENGVVNGVVEKVMIASIKEESLLNYE